MCPLPVFVIIRILLNKRYHKRKNRREVANLKLQLNALDTPEPSPPRLCRNAPRSGLPDQTMSPSNNSRGCGAAQPLPRLCRNPLRSGSPDQTMPPAPITLAAPPLYLRKSSTFPFAAPITLAAVPQCTAERLASPSTHHPKIQRLSLFRNLRPVSAR